MTTAPWLQHRLGSDHGGNVLDDLPRTIAAGQFACRPRSANWTTHSADDDDDDAMEIVESELAPDLASITTLDEREHLYAHVVDRIKNHGDALHEASMEGSRRRRDHLHAGGQVTVIPAWQYAVLVPSTTHVAGRCRVSNSVLIALLFAVGFCWGRVVRMNCLVTGLAIMVIGVAMVGIAGMAEADDIAECRDVTNRSVDASFVAKGPRWDRVATPSTRGNSRK